MPTNSRNRGTKSRIAAAALIADGPEVVAGLLLAAITVILFFGVVWRYFLTDPLTWSDEIARALFVWLSFVGAAVAVRPADGGGRLRVTHP